MTVVYLALVALVCVLLVWWLTTGRRMLDVIRDLRAGPAISTRNTDQPRLTDAELHAWLEDTSPIKETESSAP